MFFKRKKKNETEPVCEAVTEEDAKNPAVNYIENPLPLPKKHVNKIMDFDIQISEKDDFDV